MLLLLLLLLMSSVCLLSLLEYPRTDRSKHPFVPLSIVPAVPPCKPPEAQY